MIVYDLECYPNIFSCCAVSMDKDDFFTWEISDRRNDAASLVEWLRYLAYNQIEMVGFNNLGYDYILVHELLTNPITSTYETLYAKSQAIFSSQNGPNQWQHRVWPSDRIIPQVDLFKVWHFDNKAKSQSLKGLEFNLRSPTIVDLPFKPGTNLTDEQKDRLLKYGEHDVKETRRFARISLPEIDLRRKILDEGLVSGDVLNFNSVKIGTELLIQRMGDVCWERDANGKRHPRQTIRSHIPLQEVIFPYIKFEHPEFKRIHEWMLNQTLTPDDMNPDRASTKGVFKGVSAMVDGFQFNYGTGGIHGSVSSKAFHSDSDRIIVDADVASLYPSIAIMNRLAPAHLKDCFVEHYAGLKTERFKYAKGTPENAVFKLGLNGTFGNSNQIYSPLYDPAFAMAITLNGQLLLSMLAEWLIAEVPGLEMCQINTDGITARIPRNQREKYDSVCKRWEEFTLLELEFAEYQSMWLRDVNNYLALSTKQKIKTKGAYWSPDTFDEDAYVKSISDGPGAWHRPLNCPIVAQAAVAQMAHSVPIEVSIAACSDPFNFMLMYKSTRGSILYIDDAEQQRVTRYHVAKRGGSMFKISPPVEGSIPGAFKRASSVSQYEYEKHDPFVWNEKVHTKNKSKYEDRKTAIQKGWIVSECNDISMFDWDNLNVDYYIAEAKKLIVE